MQIVKGNINFKDANRYDRRISQTRRVWRYQRGNQNPYTEEQTTQWPKEKVQNSIYFSINCYKTLNGI